jgi:hypothetical protein
VPELTYDQAAAAVRKLGQQLRALEAELDKVGSEHADAEGAYRVLFANAMRRHRKDGATVAEAEAFAKADAASLARARDRSESRIRELLEQLEDRRGERHSLHRLMDWSMTRPATPEDR